MQDWYNILLVVPVIGFFFLNFFGDSTLDRLAKKFEPVFKEKEREQLEMNERASDFPGRFKRLSKIMVLRSMASWIYKNGWVFCILLILVLLNGYLIRVNNLNILPLQNDEFLTHNAVKYIVQGNFSLTDLKYGADDNQSDEFYSRALPYSLGAAIITKMFGGDYYSYFNLRYFSVICGFLTLIVFYFLLRKHLPRPVIIFTIFGLSTYYLLVYYSRVARMYAFHILLFFLMIFIFDWLFSKIKKDRITEHLGLRGTARYFWNFFKKNFIGILLFVAVLAVDLKSHYTAIFVLPIIFFYSLLNLRSHRQLFYPILLVIVALLVFAGLFLFGYHFIGDWYFNTEGEHYWKFLDYNFAFLKGGYLSILIFLFPLLFFKYIPSLIKLSYAAFFSIVPMYVFLFNGITFHDPRYLMFLYPFFVITVIYSLHLIVKMVLINIKGRFADLLYAIVGIFLFIMVVSPFVIGGVCVDNRLFSCPISSQSKIFNVDRWNYNHDAYFQIIKNNLTDDTLIISRSIYDFYLKKYNITNDTFLINTTTKEYMHGPNFYYFVSELEKEDIVFIVYPYLAYSPNTTEPYDKVYDYLINKRNDKKVLYQSSDNKVIVYQLDKIK
jgi:hypothetical protein